MRVPASCKSCSDIERRPSKLCDTRSERTARRACFSIQRKRRSAARGRFVNTARKAFSRCRHSDAETSTSSMTTRARQAEICSERRPVPARTAIERACAITRYRAAASARDRIDPTNRQVQTEKPRETGPTDKTPTKTTSPATMRSNRSR